MVTGLEQSRAVHDLLLMLVLVSGPDHLVLSVTWLRTATWSYFWLLFS